MECSGGMGGGGDVLEHILGGEAEPALALPVRVDSGGRTGEQSGELSPCASQQQWLAVASPDCVLVGVSSSRRRRTVRLRPRPTRWSSRPPWAAMVAVGAMRAISPPDNTPGTVEFDKVLVLAAGY